MFKGLKSTKKMPPFNSNFFGIRKFIKLDSYISTLEGPRASEYAYYVPMGPT